MLESIILGTVQGIAEWLPVSSEGLLVLTQVKLFGSEAPLEELIRISLFLHLGTFFASLIYFWADIKKLTALLAGYLTRKRSTETAEPADRKVLGFLLTATVITGTIGVLLLFGLKGIEDKIELGGREVMAFVGALLLVTGYLQIKSAQNKGIKYKVYSIEEDAKTRKVKSEKDLKFVDAILLGIMQGFAVLPGLSRSGLTVAGLLLRKFDDTVSLRLSFLMSMPVVLAGNIFLNADKFALNANLLAGLFASFLFGLITIHILLKVARKINFGYFVLIFGILTIASVFV